MSWVTGTVVQGEGRGKELGFPTANIELHDAEGRPSEGVYAAWVLLGDERYMGAMHVGPRPTFDDKTATVEIHMLDYEGADVYGKDISFAPVRRIRDVEKFDTIEKLVAAIETDCRKVREILRVHP